MRLLCDTHLLIWLAENDRRLTAEARGLLDQTGTERAFSVASLWEIAIKFSLERPDFPIAPQVMRQGLIASGFVELAIDAQHAFAVVDLPRLHRDPFDRLLIAQARVEGLTLLTADAAVAAYGGEIRLI